MREQTIFFEEQIGDEKVVVLKTYDSALAREAFDQMSVSALEALAQSLDLESKFDLADIPSPTDAQFPDFLWEAIEDSAREDWNSFSYFIVQRRRAANQPLFVSSDWPSAEAYAKTMLLSRAT